MWAITTSGLYKGRLVFLGWMGSECVDLTKSAQGDWIWTSKEIIRKITENNTPEHPFLFNTRKEAEIQINKLHLPQKCKTVRFV